MFPLLNSHITTLKIAELIQQWTKENLKFILVYNNYIILIVSFVNFLLRILKHIHIHTIAFCILLTV